MENRKLTMDVRVAHVRSAHLVRDRLAPDHGCGNPLPLRPRLEIETRGRRQHHAPADAEVVTELFPRP